MFGEKANFCSEKRKKNIDKRMFCGYNSHTKQTDVRFYEGEYVMAKILKAEDVLNQIKMAQENPDQNESENKYSNQRHVRRMMRLACRRRARRQRIHKFIVALLVMIAFCSGFFGRTLFDAYAEEEGSNAHNRYYTSIRLEPGDNLWKIAGRYAKEAGYTVSQYVEELKRINQLPYGQVHSGKYLTIVYLPE